MEDKKDTKIKLAVKPNVNVTTITQANVKSKINFEDDRLGDPQDPADPTTWVSKVDKGKKVVWSGITDTNRNISISVTKVTRDTSSDVKILKKDTYTDSNNDGIVTGQVKDSQVDGDEAYTVYFTINSGPTLYIDPKLRMH